MDARKGILLSADFDLTIVPKYNNGLIQSGLLIGDSLDQDAILVLKMSPGELKDNPLLGPGLPKFIRGKSRPFAIEDRIKQHFEKVAIDYDSYKSRIKTTIISKEL